jgi:hypothetical protein
LQVPPTSAQFVQAMPASPQAMSVVPPRHAPVGSQQPAQDVQDEAPGPLLLPPASPPPLE